MEDTRLKTLFIWEGVTYYIIPDGEIELFLTQRGYEKVINVDSEDLKRIYFSGVNAHRQVAPVYQIVHATVRPSI